MKFEILKWGLIVIERILLKLKRLVKRELDVKLIINGG